MDPSTSLFWQSFVPREGPEGPEQELYEDEQINKSLVKFAFLNAVEELNTLFIYESFFLAALEPQIKMFTFKFTAFQHILKDEAETEQQRARIDGALKTLTDAAIDVKSITDNFLVKTARHKRMGSFNKFVFYLNDWRARRVAVRKLELIRIKLEDLIKVPETEESVSTSPFTVTPWRFNHGFSEHDLVGRNKDIKVIKEMLFSDARRLQVISVVGMQGIGKTAIALRICKDYKVNYGCKSSFDFIAWINCGDSLYSVEILKNKEDTKKSVEILKNKEDTKKSHHFRKNWKHNSQMKRMMEDALHGTTEINNPQGIAELLRNKRYLIIFDDVATTKVFDNVRSALINSNKVNFSRGLGSRILLTTRDTRVALHAIHEDESQPPYRLGPLDDKESWELFNMKVREYFAMKVCPNPPPQDLESIGKEIVKKCHGLPLAIQHLAQYLSKKRISSDEWSKVLESANKQQDNDYQTTWLYIVDMIVNDLPLNLKRCLLYLGFFPQKSTIRVKRLIALWIAEGFVEPKYNKTLESIAEDYIQELIGLNMIQVPKQPGSSDRPKTCYLANYLDEHLLTRANQANYASSMSSTSRTVVRTSRSTVGARRLADHPGDNKPMESPDSYRMLLSFLSFDNRKGSAPGEKIKNFLHGGIKKGCFQLLRVLDLEGVNRPRLPKEIGRLIHLRYLGLRGTYISTLPSSIRKLTNLQTLDVQDTYINYLPISIWRMRELRHLYLNENHLKSLMHQPNDSYFENLQTLWGISIGEDSIVERGLDRFTKLTMLGIEYHLTSALKQNAMVEWIFKLVNLRSLRLISKDRFGEPSSSLELRPLTKHMNLVDLYLFGRLEKKLFEVDEFPPFLTELTLSASKLEEDPMPTLERLPNLRVLRFYSNSYTGKFMACSSSGFVQLQVLKIWKLHNLEKWTVEKGAMPVLQILEIRCCENLKMLPVGLQEITTLQEVKLTAMPKTFRKRVRKDKKKYWYKKARVHFDDWNPDHGKPTKRAGLLRLHLHKKARVNSSRHLKHARVKGRLRSYAK